MLALNLIYHFDNFEFGFIIYILLLIYNIILGSDFNSYDWDNEFGYILSNFVS